MGPQATDGKTRAKILAIVQKEPGIHMRKLARKLDCHVNLVDYHLRVLEKGGKVTSVEKSGRKGFFPLDRSGEKMPLTAKERKILLLLRNQRLLEIIIWLIVNEGGKSGEVSKEVDIAPSTSSYHLGRLEKEGLVTKDKGTQKYVLEEPENVAALIIDYDIGSHDLVESFRSIWEEMSLGLD